MATYYSSYILDLVTIFNVSGSGPNPAGSKITGSGWDPDPKILGPVHPIILFFFCQIISLLLTQVYILPPKLKQSQYFLKTVQYVSDVKMSVSVGQGCDLLRQSLSSQLWSCKQLSWSLFLSCYYASWSRG